MVFRLRLDRIQGYGGCSYHLERRFAGATDRANVWRQYLESTNPRGRQLSGFRWNYESLLNQRCRPQAAVPTMQSVVPSLATSTARTKPLAPSSIAVEAGKNDWSWLNKITVQKHQTDTSELHRHQWKMLQRTLTTFSRHKQRPKKNSFKDNEPHSYSEEIQQYIAESTANLNCGDEPQDSSDDDDDSDSDIAIPRNAEIFDFSDFVDDYVVPPVEVPRTYCLQDRQGGTLVAGDYVTFTNWAFKRQLRHIGDLCPIPERGEPGQDEDEPSQGIYSGMTVEL